MMKLTGMQIKVIWRLHRRGKYGGSHTPIENAVKGFQKDRRGEVLDAFKDLVRSNIVMKKPTNYGMEVSLNQDQNAFIRLVCDWYAANAGTVKDRGTYEIG